MKFLELKASALPLSLLAPRLVGEQARSKGRAIRTKRVTTRDEAIQGKLRARSEQDQAKAIQ